MVNLKKKLFCAIALCIVFQVVCAEIKSPWSFSNTVMGGYVPKTDYVAGPDHFAPITGAYEAIQIGDFFSASYTMPVMRSKNPLFASNALVYTGAIELTPITFMPKISVKFIPIAFLEFETGISFGTGWRLSFMDTNGLSAYNSNSKKYEPLTPFASWMMTPYLSATFQFDAAALWPGEWHHIVTQWTFTANYSHLLTNEKYDTFYIWQNYNNFTNGWNYVVTGIIGYQMPIVLSMVGLHTIFSGYFSKNDYGKYGDTFNGSFTEIQIAPLIQFTFLEKHTITVLPTFKLRRAFYGANANKTANDLPSLVFSGHEWQFFRLAFAWTVTF